MWDEEPEEEDFDEAGYNDVKTRYLDSNDVYLPMLEMLSRAGAKAGTGFVILMEHDGKLGLYKDYSIHPRFGQPCQGGDMRRYESAHPGLCTQPHDERPTDLSQPFPSGKPSAIAFHNLKTNTDGSMTDMFEALVSDSSPWRSGFGGRKNVVTYSDDKGNPIGYILKNLDVDPTVLVNGVNFINTVQGFVGSFKVLKDEGLTDNEALAVMMLNGCGQLTGLVATNDYRHPPIFSSRRFFEQRPNDLSGGLYSNGCDYNRTFVQDVFLGDRSKGGIIWSTDMSKRFSGLWTPALIAKHAKELFLEGLEKEDPIMNEPYVYRDASGEVLPYPEAALRANPNLKQTENREAA